MSDVMVELWRLAHGRTGDKGNRSNISVIAWDQAFYPLMAEQLTADRVQAHFAFRRPQAVVRYDLPRLSAFNFVLDDVLDGGVNDSLNLDSHGKVLSFHLLTVQMAVPRHLLPLLRGPAA